MNAFPTVEESFDRLHWTGWSAGYARFGKTWRVYGANGEIVVDAEGATLEEAYWRACEQARECGMLAPTRLPKR